MSNPRIITIFGGSSPKPGEHLYEEAVRLGRTLVHMGFGVATGGYMGTMEAISRGASEEGGHVIGVTCDQVEMWRPIGPNPWLSEEIRQPRLIDRAHTLIDIGDALVAFPGSIGTLTEITIAWALLQIEAIQSKPLILIGTQWKDMLDQFSESSEHDVHRRKTGDIHFVPDIDSAVDVLERSLGS